MSHKYPHGAIEDETGLLFAMLGRTLYGVHGLGKRSFLTVMENVRNLHTTPSDYGDGFRKIEYTGISGNESWETSSCLGDYNIGHHHNQHYLFHLREDAEAYLEWAKENTPKIRNSWYD
jgi:hypothetical protein